MKPLFSENISLKICRWYYGISNSHDARPWSDKLLIDTTFDKIDLSEASWDLIDNDERESLQDIVLKEKNEKRRLMLERAKAVFNGKNTIIPIYADRLHNIILNLHKK